MINRTQLDQLKREAEELVGFRLPRDTFYKFDDDLNTRLLVGITCLQSGYTEQAYQIFSTIAAEGPQEEANHHFAYVRSLVELAELDASNGDFVQAEQKMEEALKQYPLSMGYMMSRVHLEVYLTYYKFKANKREEAEKQIQQIISREIEKFKELPLQDAFSLIGPGLCYAIHQWALFYADQEEWDEAIEKFKTMLDFAPKIDKHGLEEVETLLEKNQAKQAFFRLTESVRYGDGS